MTRPWLQLLDSERDRPPHAASLVAARLRSLEPIPDGAFDRLLPARLRVVAEQHWTPLAVSRRVARWIEELQIGSVVDLGSGAGKFCVATALAAPHCRFIGIEQRPWLADAARGLAAMLGVDDRVSFVTGAVGEVAVPGAEAYYLYNPFGENLFTDDSRIAEDVELGGERYRRDIATVARLLAGQPRGTYVIKYNGYGGKMPRGYEVVRRDLEHPNLLRVWRKR